MERSDRLKRLLLDRAGVAVAWEGVPASASALAVGLSLLIEFFLALFDHRKLPDQSASPGHC